MHEPLPADPESSIVTASARVGRGCQLTPCVVANARVRKLYHHEQLSDLLHPADGPNTYPWQRDTGTDLLSQLHLSSRGALSYASQLQYSASSRE